MAGDHYGRHSEKYGRLLLNAGIGLQNGTKPLSAKKYLESAYDIFIETLGQEDTTTGLAAYRLGRLHFFRFEYRAAEPYLLAALDTFDDPQRPSAQVEIDTHGYLVEIYERLRKPEKGTPHCLALGRVTPVDNDQEYFPIYSSPPIYPAAALEKRREGYVSFKFTVDEMGIVRNPEVVEVVGHPSFEGPALEALKRQRYAPRFVGGKPVATENVTTRHTFTIED